MRGATSQCQSQATQGPHFNPRSSCEERPSGITARPSTRAFQSTLLMRGATSYQWGRCGSSTFQSTLLMRGATRSSHRLLTISTDFNPRSSCEERLKNLMDIEKDNIISIHAPHARSDGSEAWTTYMGGYFNPRSSCEERRHVAFKH